MIGRFRALPFAISYGQPHTAVMGHHIPAVVGIRRRISGMQRAACWPAGIRTTSGHWESFANVDGNNFGG
jgi:hypothetical protein